MYQICSATILRIHRLTGTAQSLHLGHIQSCAIVFVPSSTTIASSVLGHADKEFEQRQPRRGLVAALALLFRTITLLTFLQSNFDFSQSR